MYVMSLLFMSLNFYLHKCHTLQQIHANNLEMQMQMSFLSWQMQWRKRKFRQKFEIFLKDQDENMFLIS